LEIIKADYIKARTNAAEKLLNRAIRERDQEAKEKALQLLDHLRKEA
jgi:predicted RNA-binding protein